MQIIGVALLSLGALGLVFMAAHIAWQEAASLLYVNRLDEWASEVPEWE